MRENALAALFRDWGYKIAFYPANKNISITSTAFDPQKNVFNEYLKMEAIELSLLLVDNLFLLNSFDTFLVYSSEVLFSCLSLVLMMTVLVENSLTAKEV